MSSTSTAYFPLATEDPYTGSDGSAADSGNGIDNDGGASGTSSGSMTLSHGGLIAIIIVVVVVAVGGITSMVLFYLAKKHEWKVRENLRRSARKVVAVLTPRRSEFPQSVRDGRAGHARGRVRLDDVPPTPRLPVDLEKGLDNPSPERKIKLNFSRK